MKFSDICILMHQSVSTHHGMRFGIQDFFIEATCDGAYGKMTKHQREFLFEFVRQHHDFDTENDSCRLFYARFDPANQYEVECFHEGKMQVVDCFLWKGRYHLSSTDGIAEECIKLVMRKYPKTQA